MGLNARKFTDAPREPSRCNKLPEQFCAGWLKKFIGEQLRKRTQHQKAVECTALQTLCDVVHATERREAFGMRRIPAFRFSTPMYKKTPPLPCVTVPLNLLETGGTRWTAFDFQ